MKVCRQVKVRVRVRSHFGASGGGSSSGVVVVVVLIGNGVGRIANFRSGCPLL